jgi:hypothetical protein
VTQAGRLCHERASPNLRERQDHWRRSPLSAFARL